MQQEPTFLTGLTWRQKMWGIIQKKTSPASKLFVYTAENSYWTGIRSWSVLHSNETIHPRPATWTDRWLGKRLRVCIRLIAETFWFLIASSFRLPWWKDVSLVVGRLTVKTRQIRIKNMLTRLENVLTVTYLPYCPSDFIEIVEAGLLWGDDFGDSGYS